MDLQGCNGPVEARACEMNARVVLLACLSLAPVWAQLLEPLVRQPLLQRAGGSLTHAIAATLNTLSSPPLAIARALGGSLELPSAASNINLADATNILRDFRAASSNEDAHLNITSLVNKYGMPIEEYEVATEDGYLLTMFRIPGEGPVVFLMHGVLGSADDFVIGGPEKGLAYLLANEGYDVWMGNARGNKHCRKHLELKPSQSAFWDFSWHEIGVFDLPTMIDTALQESKREKLSYIGHSQGTTTFFVMASEKPEYNEKISLMIALSPVAFLSNVKAPVVRMLAPGGPLLERVLGTFGFYEFLPDHFVLEVLKSVMCGGFGPLSEVICVNTIFMVTGFGLEQLDVKQLPVLYGHMPSGASMKQFLHFGQGVVSDDFRQFDYGTRKNIEVYGSEVPPSYRLERITAPVSLFHSSEDWLATPPDVDRLYQRLGSCIDIYDVPIQQFSHLDFLFARDVSDIIIKRVKALLLYFRNN